MLGCIYSHPELHVAHRLQGWTPLVTVRLVVREIVVGFYEVNKSLFKVLFD